MILRKGDRVRAKVDIIIDPDEDRIIHAGDIGIATGEIDTGAFRIAFALGKYCLHDYEIELI